MTQKFDHMQSAVDLQLDRIAAAKSMSAEVRKTLLHLEAIPAGWSQDFADQLANQDKQWSNFRQDLEREESGRKMLMTEMSQKLEQALASFNSSANRRTSAETTG